MLTPAEESAGAASGLSAHYRCFGYAIRNTGLNSLIIGDGLNLLHTLTGLLLRHQLAPIAVPEMRALRIHGRASCPSQLFTASTTGADTSIVIITDFNTGGHGEALDAEIHGRFQQSVLNQPLPGAVWPCP